MANPRPWIAALALRAKHCSWLCHAIAPIQIMYGGMQVWELVGRLGMQPRTLAEVRPAEK